jgi:tetratricopeptide (TPR) repeat protein
MRNKTPHSGVYSNMNRLLLVLACSIAALAQQPSPQDPVDAAIQTFWRMDSAHFQEAAAAREQARALLQRVPATSPRFAGWAQQVAQLYQNAGLNAQARAVLEDGLARTAPLGESDPSPIAMLNALAGLWQQDGSLLKAVGYLEQAAAAQAAAPVTAPAPRASQGAAMYAGRVYAGNFIGGGYSGNAIQAYIRLADLYRALASFYEQLGKFADAAAIYRNLADQANDPQAKASALQMLAGVAARQQHFSDAVAAMDEAIATVQPTETPLSFGPSWWMQQTRAIYLRDAGLLDQADQAYRQLLQQSHGGPQETQSLSAYAGYLAQTKRGVQAQGLLQDYLADNPSLDPPQRSNILYSLANVARQSGDNSGADRYQQAAQALQPPPQPPAGEMRIAGILQEAQNAASQHRLSDAYRLAGDAIDAAPSAADGQQIEWMAPQIANLLAAQRESAKADQLFQRLLAVAQTWKVHSAQPLLTVTQNYVRFLESQPERLSEVPAAIEQYRQVLIEANGPGSGTLAEPLRMSLEFARVHSQWAHAAELARALLTLQESLSGNTSDPYLGDLQTVARMYQVAGDSARALPLFRKAITLADLLATPNNDWRGVQTRMDAAFALAAAGQFDEAETLAEEAVALQRTMRNPGPPVEQQLEQIRQMKRAAAARSASRVQG